MPTNASGYNYCYQLQALMRTLRKIFRFIVCFILSGYILLLAVLNYSPLQQAMTQYLAETLAKELHSGVHIGSVQVGLFNRVMLQDVRINDLKGTPILQARSMSAKIELRTLFKKQISLRTVSLLDATVNLYREAKDKPANYQFIIDTFSSKNQEEESTPLNLRINSLILRRVNLRYHELYELSTPGKVNLHHLDIQQLNANISLKSLRPELLQLRVRSLSFSEQSGFSLNNLSLKLSAEPGKAILQDLEIGMPHSSLQMPLLTATWQPQQDGSIDGKTLRVEGGFNNATISTADLQCLPLPEHLLTTKRFDVQCTTVFRITPGQVEVTKLNLQETNGLFALAMSGNTSRKSNQWERLQLDLNSLQLAPQFTLWLAASCFPNNAVYTQVATQIGKLQAKGKLTFSLQNRMQGELQLQTDAGMATATARLEGHEAEVEMDLTQLAVSQLLSRPELPDLLSLQARMQARGISLASLSQWQQTLRNARIEIKVPHVAHQGRHYGNIEVQSLFTPGQLQVHFRSADPSLQMLASAQMFLKGWKIDGGSIDLQVPHVSPGLWGMQGDYGKAHYSGNLRASLQNICSGHWNGDLRLTDFSMTGSQKGDYRLNSLQAKLSSLPDGRSCVELQSDLLDATLTGSPDFAQAVRGLQTLLYQNLPGLRSPGSPSGQTGAATAAKKETPSGWQIRATLRPTDMWQNVANIPLVIQSPIHVEGTLSDFEGRTSLSVDTDSLTVGNQFFGRTSIYLSGHHDGLTGLVKTQKSFGGHIFNWALRLQAANDTLHSLLSWQAQQQPQSYNGTFRASTQFSRQTNGHLTWQTDIHPTHFLLSDTIWNIASGHLAIGDGALSFQGVSLSHHPQSLTVDGRLMQGSRDSIVAHLHEMDVDYILNLIDFDAVEFGGRATGQAIFNKSGGETQLHANLHIPEFRFNKGLMGDAQIKGNWNPTENRINLEADMKLPGGQGYGTKVNGFVSLAEKGLDLHMQTNHTRLAFLRRYTDGIFSHLDGDATGNLRLFGPFKKLDFEGKLTANAQALIPSTGVTYRISEGTVECTPGQFAFHDFRVSDLTHGSGTASGYLRHTHLKNLTYDFTVNAENMLCYDQPSSPLMPFYSTTTGTGQIHLQGQPGIFAADIRIRPLSPTTFVYTQGTASSLDPADRMIRFHDATERDLSSGWQQTDSANASATTGQPLHTAEEDIPQEAESDIYLNFLIEATPGAELKVITDPRSGDAITAYGSGTLRATYHNKGNFEMYGTYTLQRGTYNMSIQDLIRKGMALQQGSTITFAGNPAQADLALKAVYSLSGVPLSDLNYAAGFGQRTARVDCILNIGGQANAPQVSFDIDLQGISDDEKRMVRQLIATDEDMNRQAISLLGIGRFYAAGSTETEGATSGQSTAAMRSLLSTTLTGQLNSVISSALGSRSHWSFGTNLTPGTMGWNDLEVDGQLQGRLLGDRLLINGNFGYRDRPTYTSNFVGDFDIRYILTPHGGVSLRAYSETSDRYFTPSSLTTQGVGITLQRDFTRFGQLFRPIRKDKKKP